jgi:hypothetical protein
MVFTVRGATCAVKLASRWRRGDFTFQSQLLDFENAVDLPDQHSSTA